MKPAPEPLPSILVVDDTPANLQLLVGMLQECGYAVRPVTNGVRALRAVRSAPPDLILLDITMPDMDGYEVCRRLKEDPATREIPVLFISALTETEDKLRAFQAGGVDYVSKPFQFEEVEARVRTHLELGRQKRELRGNYARLLELERLRDSLTHMIVHDMRTPLLTMQLSIGLLRDVLKDESPESGELVDNAQHGVNQLVEMAEQMLAVSRMEAGKMELRRQRIDLAAMVAEVVAASRLLVGSRRIILTTPRPAWAECDPDLVRRVIGNLVGNALKFTASTGTIEVTITLELRAVRVAVKDDGPGIAPEHHQRIFAKFGRIEGRATDRPGYGLGLTFCKMAVEAHGGQIGLESAPGQGSTFWCTLPTEAAAG